MGRPSPRLRRAADLSDAATLAETIAHWNEAWMVAARRLSPRLLCELLTETGEALKAFYRGLDLARGDAVSWAGPKPAPVWLDIVREHTEQWVHQAQIRDALDLPVLDEPRLFAPVLTTKGLDRSEAEHKVRIEGERQFGSKVLDMVAIISA